MAKRIDEFPSLAVPTSGDLILLWDSVTSTTKQIKMSDLKAYLIEGLSTGGGDTGGEEEPPTSSTTTKILTYASDGDTNGVSYWLGSNYGQEIWTNPYSAGRLLITASGLYDTTFSDIKALVDRVPSRLIATQDAVGGWFMLDLGAKNTLSCNLYSLRGRNVDDGNLRSWKFQGSVNASSWTDLDVQSNNSTLNLNTWFSKPILASNPYRYFRIISTGSNSTSTNYLSLGEWEFYGTLSTST